MVNNVMLMVIILCVIMLSDVILSTVMQSVIIPIVFMVSVLANDYHMPPSMCVHLFMALTLAFIMTC